MFLFLRITYSSEKNLWEAVDMNSTNGFWISMRDYRDMPQPIESGERLLENPTKFRISKYELEVIFFYKRIKFLLIL